MPSSASCVNCDEGCAAGVEDHADRASAACGAVLEEERSTYVPPNGGRPTEMVKYKYCRCTGYEHPLTNEHFDDLVTEVIEQNREVLDRLKEAGD